LPVLIRKFNQPSTGARLCLHFRQQLETFGLLDVVSGPIIMQFPRHGLTLTDNPKGADLSSLHRQN
jgi:hypothetical protein